MRILSILIVGLLLSNCTNSYVKNKKTITSPDDLMKFTNVWCEKQKQTDNIIKMCGQGWSKDLNISESKAIICRYGKGSLSLCAQLRSRC